MAGKQQYITFDWELILESLANQKCILFVGPQFYVDEGGRTLEERLYDELKVSDPAHPFIRAFYEEDGFFLFREQRFRRRIVRELRQFYSQSLPEVSSLLEKMSRIPFHLIISLTPDDLMAKAHEKLGLKFRQDFYFKNHPPNAFVQPSREKPLIYNLLGSLEEEESLVLSHNDLFDYLHSVFARKSMSVELRNKFINAHNYLFLGLPFEKWYLQLLFRVLSFHSERLKGLDRFASFPSAKIKKVIFEQEFNIEFIPDKAQAFVEELYRRCEEKGLLRELPAVSEATTPEPSADQLWKLIAKAETMQAMQQLESTLKNKLPESEIQLQELILLMNQYQLLEKKMQLGMGEKEDEREKNRITYAFLNLIREVQVSA